MDSTGIVVKVSAEEYRLLLSMRNTFISVESLRDVLNSARIENTPYTPAVEQLLSQLW